MFKKILSLTISICFLLTTLGPLPKVHADSVLDLPAPGTMVNLSPAYEPVIIKGLTVHKDNPFLFDFIVDVGQDKMSGEPLKKEGEKLIKYFLAGLAIPDKDVWVNLSPYEKNRMIPEALGQTDMGRDLLEQDYILKQITASLIYPEKQIGKTFWDRVYAKSQAMYGTTQIPVNTFNKVWIMADRAEVLERNQTAFVVDQHLKVLLEEDYLALSKHQMPTRGHVSEGALSPSPTNTIASQIVREIILPELEKEVNTGKNFANLRQIFNSIILSSWYKINLKQALLNQVYANHSKIKGINLNDPTIKEQIYQQYLKAYKKGVFNYIKEEVAIDPESKKQGILPKKYFSGGIQVEVGKAGRPDTELLTPANSGLFRRSLQNSVEIFETGMFNAPIKQPMSGNATTALKRLSITKPPAPSIVTHDYALLSERAKNIRDHFQDSGESIDELRAEVEDLIEKIKYAVKYNDVKILPPLREEVLEHPLVQYYQLMGAIFDEYGNAPISNRSNLSIVYTPFVGTIAKIIAADPEFFASRLGALKEFKDPDLYVISDGSALLGYGNMGPGPMAAVANGKKILIRHFGGVKANVALVDNKQLWEDWKKAKEEAKNPEDVTARSKAISMMRKLEEQIAGNIVEEAQRIRKLHPNVGFMMEDIAAPLSYIVEERLNSLGIPTMHDDQHGTAIVVGAGVLNALKKSGIDIMDPKKLKEVKIVIQGAGPAGLAVAKNLHALGIGNIIILEINGALYPGMKDFDLLDPNEQALASFYTVDPDNPEALKLKEGETMDPKSPDRGKYLHRLLQGANGYIGLSRGKLYYGMEEEILTGMAPKAFVFPLSNPDGEFYAPKLGEMVRKGQIGSAAIGSFKGILAVDTINNSTAFPGWLRGLSEAIHDGLVPSGMEPETIIGARMAATRALAETELSLEIRATGKLVAPSFNENGFNTQLTGIISKAVYQNLLDVVQRKARQAGQPLPDGKIAKFATLARAIGMGNLSFNNSLPSEVRELTNFKFPGGAGSNSGLVGIQASLEVQRHWGDIIRLKEAYENDSTAESLGRTVAKLHILLKSIQLFLSDAYLQEKQTIDAEIRVGIQENITVLLEQDIELHRLLTVAIKKMRGLKDAHKVAIFLNNENLKHIEDRFEAYPSQYPQGDPRENIENDLFMLRAALLAEELARTEPGVNVSKIKEKEERIKGLIALGKSITDLQDRAMLNGGIDLNTSNGMRWKISKDGKGIEMTVDPAMIAQVKRDGVDNLIPVIFRITPVTSIWSLVGLQAPVQAERLAGV